MESVELCARLSRLVRADATTTGDEPTEIRATLDALIAFYDDTAARECQDAAAQTVAGVDDMVLVTLQRLLLTTLRSGCDAATQERAFIGAVLLLRRCGSRLSPARIVEMLQAAALYLPTPTAAIDPATAPSGTVQTKTDEELTIAVLEVVQLLLSTSVAGAAVQQLTRSQDSTHFLAYVVSSLLQLAERERHRGLAELAIRVLKRLLDRVAPNVNVLRMFFPGVSVGMWKTMSAPLQSSKVVVAALECLTTTISTCLGGSAHSNSPVPSQYSLERLRQLEKTTSASNETQPTDVWLEQAVDKVDHLLSYILSSKGMDRQPWRVRLAMVDLCGVVVLRCRVSLAPSFFRCFEELMVLSTHAITNVSQVAIDTMECLRRELPLDEWLSLESQFAERFLLQLSTLELNCGTEQESSSAHTMDILIGYIQFQQQRFRTVLDDSMPSIFKTLRHVLAFAGFDIDLLRHERPREDFATASGRLDVLPYFQKRFRHFHEESTVSVAIRLLQNLGSIATPAVVVDTAMQTLQTEEQDDQENRDAVLVIMNECLRAQLDLKASQMDSIHLVGRVLDDLLQLPLWSSTSRRDKNATTLLIECVGICVDLCGTAFEEFLVYVLYPLVEKLGDSATQVERAALTTLQKISYVCGHGDLHALFSANMDYFVDALCARLEQLETYPQSPQVVEALLRHSTVSSLPLIDEIARSLLRAVDLYHDTPAVAVALLRSLQLLLGSFAVKSSTSELPPAAINTPDETPPLTRFLQEMRVMVEPLSSELTVDENEVAQDDAEPETTAKSAMPVEFDTQNEIDEDHPADADNEDDPDKELPSLPFQTQTVEILERCSYFLADADPMACCLVLETMVEGVRYLRGRQKELLPLIHRIWPSILHRLTVANRPILTATMELLATLAECAGDFIGDRFIETVWPPVKTLLASIGDSESSAGDIGTLSLKRSMLLLSVDESNGALQPVKEDPTADTVSTSLSPMDRRLTFEAKLLNATLRCLCVVCEKSTTVMSLVPDIIDSCARFLSPTFAGSTVTWAKDLMLVLATLNGDEVFVAMATLSQWQPPPAPSTRFPSYEADYLTLSRPPKLKSNTSSHREDQTHQQLQHCRANAAFVLDQLMSRAN